MKKYLPYILLVVFTIFFVWMYAYTVNPKLDLNGDNATYIRLARNLADGHGYCMQNAEGGFTPTSIWPPAYPFVLSLFVRMGVDSLMGFKVLNAVFCFLSLLCVAFLVEKLTRQRWLAFSVAVLTVMSPQMLSFAGMAMSEMLYMLATVCTLLALYLYAQRDTVRFYASPWFYAAVVCASWAYYTRTIGATILFTVVVFFLFRKEWLASLGALAGMAVCILPWSLRNRAYGLGGSRYIAETMYINPRRQEEGVMDSFGLWWDRISTNIQDIFLDGFREILFPFSHVSGNFGIILVGILIVAVCVIGAWNAGKMRWALIGYFVATAGFLSIWYGGHGTRYITPLIPLIFALFYMGVWSIYAYGKHRRQAHRAMTLNRKGGAGQAASVRKDHSLLPLLLLVLLLPMGKPVAELHVQSKKPYPPAYFNYFSIAASMNASYPEGTVVCCRKPELFSYFAPKIHTTGYAWTMDQDELVRGLLRNKTEYVVLEQLGYSSTARYLYPAIQKYPQFFSLVYHLQNPDTYLFRFERKAAEKHFE
ncbi:MAG: glycosyltransferase family 39 protein [Bacteroides sp.]|nr:glycosyltransferase family 39 protein [Ruminococcus flavefaciens]MCM1555528.1 glycosyltransferase family 39 protein [Bacteroides sp.]